MSLAKTEFQTDLSRYQNPEYHPGRGKAVLVLWYFTNLLFLRSGLVPVSRLLVALLRLFGAQIGEGVVVKPHVSVKYPWRLRVGNHSWIGESVWIDNLTDVRIGSHVCLSQGAMLLTGNHDYKRTSFDLITGGIVLEDGVWIGARALVCPGVRCRSHAVLAVQSVANRELEAYAIYRGHPAEKVKDRILEA
jgi:putative colanic acid biosynthesis acetyltransferase WcaF